MPQSKFQQSPMHACIWHDLVISACDHIREFIPACLIVEAEEEQAFPPEPNQGRIPGVDGKQRSQIKPGMRVQVVQKQDQRSGKLTEGVVQAILTKSPTHPHGIKVRLVGGVVGRVKAVLEEACPPADGK